MMQISNLINPPTPLIDSNRKEKLDDGNDERFLALSNYICYLEKCLVSSAKEIDYLKSQISILSYCQPPSHFGLPIYPFHVGQKQQQQQLNQQSINSYNHINNNQEHKQPNIKISIGKENKYSGLAFEVGLEIHDIETNQITNFFDGSNVQLTLFNSDKRDLNRLIKDNNNCLKGIISKGRFSFRVKISEPSSKNGGKIYFEARITRMTESWTAISEKFVVKSRRSKINEKDESKLKPNDPLTKITGIGDKYAAKFKEDGISTINDLANAFTIEDILNSSEKVQNCLKHLRNHNGKSKEAALSIDDLIQWIKISHSIIINTKLQQQQQIHIPTTIISSHQKKEKENDKEEKEEEDEEEKEKEKEENCEINYIQHRSKRQKFDCSSSS